MTRKNRIAVSALCGLLAALLLQACGGGGTGARCVSATTSLSFGPSGRQVVVGSTLTFTASGGTLPYSYSVVTGSGSIDSNGVYTAATTTGAVTVRAIDATGCYSADSTLTVRAASAKIFLELDRSTGVTSTVLGLNYDYATGAVTQIGSSTLDAANSLAIRAFGFLTTGNFFMGYTSLTLDTGTSDLALASPISFTGSNLVNLHSVCQLRSGNLVAGDYKGTSQGQMWEYSSTGTDLSRQVYTSTRTSNGAMSFCDQDPNDDNSVIMMDAAATTGIGGELVKLTLSNGVWTTAARSGDFATFGSSTNTFTWAMETHTDGYVYTLPFQRNVAQYQKMIQCPVSNLSTAACVGVGNANVPDATICTGPPRVANAGSLVQIPGSNDMILTISPNNAACGTGRVYRYNYSAGTYTHIATIKGTAGADGTATVFVVPNFMWMRTAIIQ